MPIVEEARQKFVAWTDSVKANAYDADPHLRSLVRVHGLSPIEEELRAFGALTADRLDTLVRENSRDENLPRLRAWDGLGRRVEAIDFHPTYHEIGRAAYGTGAMGRYASPGREAESLAFLYLLAQNGEGGHCCPLACTAGMIKILRMSGNAPDAWMERLFDPNYDTHFRAAQFLTEVQGGSDVGTNAVRAYEESGGWRVTGEKWFCSVADAHLFLVTARPDGAEAGTKGLKAFVVPRHLPDGSVNGFAIRRLKWKLGTRTMASGEIDFDGAVAHPVGDFRRVVDIVLNTSRLYNATCSAAMMQRAFREVHAFTRARVAFGRPILHFPAVARTVARLRTETYAARGLTFALARLGDAVAVGRATKEERGAFRMLVNLNKYWTAVQGTLAVRDAIEIFGGNGTIEDFSVLPRLLRDSIVCEAWEGGHNVLCAQALRDSRRKGLHEPMFAWLASLAGTSERLERTRERWERLLAMPEELAAGFVRDVADELRPVAQAAALRAEALVEGSDPLIPTVVEHLLRTTARDADPLSDEGLADRVTRLVSV